MPLKNKNCKPIKLVGIYSHLVATDDLNEQNLSILRLIYLKNFHLKSNLTYDPILHMSNTSGIFNYPECEFDMFEAV